MNPTETEIPAKVLVIDDEQSVTMAITALLQNEGYDVDSALSGAEGLQIFRERQHDLVLTDLRLGDISGTDVLREVKSIRPRSAVIILTGYATTESAVEAVRLGANDYLTKPVRMSELAMALRNQIAAVRLNERIEALGKAVEAERDKLRRSVAELTLLKRLADRMMTAMSYREGFELILNFLVDEVQADVAAVFDLKRGELGLSSASRPNEQELDKLIEIINERGSKLSDWRTPCSRASITQSIASESANPDYMLRSWIVVPVKQEDETFGLLAAASRQDDDFEIKWFDFVEQLALAASEFLSRMKRSVERQQKMTSAIVEHTLDGLAVIDIAKPEVLLNPIARSLLEVPLGAEPTIEHIEKRLNCNLIECWGELHNQGESSAQRRTIVKHSDITWRGQHVFLRLNVSRLLETGSKDGLMLLSLYDVTQERAVEEMKNKLVSNISHELRTPTAVVKEFISLILDGVAGDLNPNQKQIIGIMRSNVERLARLIENLLSLARADSGGFNVVLRPESLYPLVEAVTESLKPKLAHKRMTLTVDLPPDIPLVYADRDSVTQILTNLIENARKYSQENTEVRVTAVTKGNRIEIAVADQGYGIPPGEIENIFKRFHRLVDKDDPRFQEGVGLGLPLVKDLVTRHGGDIWVVSEVGKGSTFYFSLQTAQEDEDQKIA
ncbi:MAG: response regulator [Calditrichaeota bacterium]|nr:response regulator [Calditrichota bacterium]